jgi:hypothetical protein
VAVVDSPLFALAFPLVLTAEVVVGVRPPRTVVEVDYSRFESVHRPAVRSASVESLPDRNNFVVMIQRRHFLCTDHP